MISLKRIVEQQGALGQYYDLGRDFANFRRTMDGSFDMIKQKFEQIIGSKLVGKRVRARASIGYKQYVKEYEFDVTRVTLDDYYDNYVVVAQDNTTPKPREYFLKPGFKIVILGQATGQPSPIEKKKEKKKPEQPPAPAPQEPSEVNPANAQSNPMTPAPAPTTKELEEKNQGTGHYDAYSVDSIAQDIKGWLPRILAKPQTAIRDFVSGLGWVKNLGGGRSVAMFDLKIPRDALKGELTKRELQTLIGSANKHGATIEISYELESIKPDSEKEQWTVRIKKTMIDRSAI